MRSLEFCGGPLARYRYQLGNGDDRLRVRILPARRDRKVVRQCQLSEDPQTRKWSDSFADGILDGEFPVHGRGQLGYAHLSPHGAASVGVMATTTHIKFGDGLAVTDEGAGVIRVDGSGGATGPAGPTGPTG